MEIDLILRARDAHDLTTTVSATLQVDDGGHSGSMVETIVRCARAAAERLREEAQPALSAAPRAAAQDFVPWATYIADADARR